MGIRRIGWLGQKWCCYFWHTSWADLSIGVHLSLSAPNVELHLPFGFVRVDRVEHLNVYKLRACNIRHHRDRLAFWENYRG